MVQLSQGVLSTWKQSICIYLKAIVLYRVGTSSEYIGIGVN